MCDLRDTWMINIKESNAKTVIALLHGRDSWSIFQSEMSSFFKNAGALDFKSNTKNFERLNDKLIEDKNKPQYDLLRCFGRFDTKEKFEKAVAAFGSSFKVFRYKDKTADNNLRSVTFNIQVGLDDSVAEVQMILSAEPKNFRAHILYEF